MDKASSATNEQASHVGGPTDRTRSVNFPRSVPLALGPPHQTSPRPTDRPPQNSGQLFGNLEVMKRNPDNFRAQERRASLVDQSLPKGVLGKAWDR